MIRRHTACVNGWLERTAHGLSPAQQIALFDLAFAAIWAQAHRTLGEITLTAIVDRVLTTATRKFPLLSRVQVEYTGISCSQLDSNGSTPESVGEALRVTLIELLRVLGTVTAEILTPSLHTALEEVRLPGAEPPAPTANTGGEREAK